jgi:hypothetical protein
MYRTKKASATDHCVCGRLSVGRRSGKLTDARFLARVVRSAMILRSQERNVEIEERGSRKGRLLIGLMLDQGRAKDFSRSTLPASFSTM